LRSGFAPVGGRILRAAPARSGPRARLPPAQGGSGGGAGDLL